MKVGFIGLGHMGKHMAANILKAGHELTITDLRSELRNDPLLQGSSWADSPKAVAQASEVVVTMLPGPEQVAQVALGPDGVLAGLANGSYYIDMSTSTPTMMHEVQQAAVKLGISVLDGPVAGGMRGARNGNLTIMVGAEQDAFDHCLPVFSAMGEQIIHVGGVGDGHVAKLVNNMMTIINGLTAMEAMVVGVKAGVDPEKLLQVAEAGTGGSFSLGVIRYVILKGNFEPAKFALSLAAKDLRIAVEYATELGIELKVAPYAAMAMAEAIEDGLGDLDWSVYIKQFEEAAGVEVRSK